jgi:hypothetical protein
MDPHVQLSIVGQPRDGNCGYHAVCHLRDLGDNALDMRFQVVNHLRKGTKLKGQEMMSGSLRDNLLAEFINVKVKPFRTKKDPAKMNKQERDTEETRINEIKSNLSRGQIKVRGVGEYIEKYCQNARKGRCIHKTYF